MKTLSIILTYKCTAACANCGTFSTPRVKETGLSYEAAAAAIRGARALGFVNVVFTGGEATLRSLSLLRLIRLAGQMGLPTRLVSNAHWASSPSRAARYVALLRHSGLGEMNFSTGVEHARFVDTAAIVEGAVATCQAGLRTVVMVEIHADRRDATGTSALIREAVRARLDREHHHLLGFVESPWMPVSPHRTAGSPADMLLNRDNARARHGCDSVLQTYVVQADARVAACCGLGMRFIPELHSDSPQLSQQTIVAFEDDLMKQALKYIGPERLLAWIAERETVTDWENRYSHKCHACLRLYRDDVIKAAFAAHAGELLVEVVKARAIQEALSHSVAGIGNPAAKLVPLGSSQ